MAQLSKENNLQKEAFEIYYHLGDKRSLKQVAEKIERTERTVAGWSRSFNWVDSLQAPLNGAMGVGVAHTTLITHDMDIKATSNGNSTVGTPVSTATVITIKS